MNDNNLNSNNFNFETLFNDKNNYSNPLNPNLYTSATMRSLLGVGEGIDFKRTSTTSTSLSTTGITGITNTLQLNNENNLKEMTYNKASTMTPLSPKRTTTIINTNPVVQTIDEKKMNSLKNDYGALYHRHFSGLEVRDIISNIFLFNKISFFNNF